MHSVSSDLVRSGPEWAQGCEQCRFGIVDSPDVRHVPLFLGRAILAHHGYILFCECPAGQAQQRVAEKVWRDIVSKRDAVHPETTAAILRVAEEQRSWTPTVHMA